MFVGEVKVFLTEKHLRYDIRGSACDFMVAIRAPK